MYSGKIAVPPGGGGIRKILLNLGILMISIGYISQTPVILNILESTQTRI
jgi:hypothetical protein